MAYEVVTAHFRTELHARWSVFFDFLEVPWAYEPQTFPAADGTGCTPAFWLSREGVWFGAEKDQAPPWWGRFAAAARGSDRVCEPWNGAGGEHVSDRPRIEVGEEWHGAVLLCLGGIPDGHTRSRGLEGGPWNRSGLGLYAVDDMPYRWTLCPECGSFGATFQGYAKRLPCRCIDGGNLDNSADDRLMAAYRAAAEEKLYTGDAEHCGRPVLPVVRKALVRQEGAVLARERCTRQCRSVGDQLRAELPPGAYAEVTKDADALCGGCPGFVCAQCGEEPAAAAGALCWTCEPLVLLTYRRARQVLNDRAGEAGHVSGRSAREINTLINRETGVRSRAQALLGELAEGLTLVERWIADSSLVPGGGATRRPGLSDAELERLHGAELSRELHQWVGPLAAACGESFALVQLRLNYVMGVEERGDADDEQLREGIRQAQEWVHRPQSYQEHARGAMAEVEPGGLPEPMRTRRAPTDSSCSLCTSPVAAGELIGRLHQPRGRRLATMGWLCTHCLYDRRTKPRRLDVLLRLFHHVFAGDGVRLNATEAEVLLVWLLASPAAVPGTEALQEVLVDLQHAIEAQDSAALLRYHGADAVVGTLHQALGPSAGVTDREADVLHAVAQHLAEWCDNPQRLNPAHYNSQMAWRRAVLDQTSRPTLLSRRSGPFPV